MKRVAGNVIAVDIRNVEMRMTKIYTRTGDRGETSLFGGKRVSKASLRVEAYGMVDELNSLIGILIAQTSNRKTQNYNSKLKTYLISIQNDLLNIGSMLANPVSKRLNPAKQGSTFIQKRVEQFEKLIDEMSEELPKLKNFILPGGGEIGSMLHLARSVARGVERRIVALSNEEKVEPEIIIYFNRLSDLLFVMSRFVNYKEEKEEVIWKK